ncbi:MAG: reverse transcriptase-like protein [Planctomycetota bacterium]|nr:MAG: reverse transcriptase-like protein [Planctomycetota bacterium]
MEQNFLGLWDKLLSYLSEEDFLQFSGISSERWREFCRFIRDRLEEEEARSFGQGSTDEESCFSSQQGRAAFVVYTDGAARGNPGPAAMGILIEDEHGQKILEHSEYLGEATNNVAEYRAFLWAARRVLEFRPSTVTFKTDSQLLARQLNGIYKVKAPHIQPLHKQALELLEALPSYKILSIPRGENARADCLANQALDGHLSP